MRGCKMLVRGVRVCVTRPLNNSWDKWLDGQSETEGYRQRYTQHDGTVIHPNGIQMLGWPFIPNLSRMILN